MPKCTIVAFIINVQDSLGGNLYRNILRHVHAGSSFCDFCSPGTYSAISGMFPNSKIIT